VKDAYVEFVENVPFYGAALLCVDHLEVQTIIPRLRDRRVVTYGFAAQADVRGGNVRPGAGGNLFDVSLRHRSGEVTTIADVALPMPGRHNVQNALAAIGVAVELGIPEDAIARGFEKFGGVKRRFTKVGELDGASIIDDYGHHPTEIKAVLSAAREGAEGRVIAVVQPHRFTRLRDLMEEFQSAFNDADIVFVTPVYPAGEEPIEGVDAEALVEGLKERGHRSVKAVADLDDLCRNLRDIAARGDMVICLGAGDITKWAAGLADGICKARAAK
jgi:UDP-N-acetylmuramate--alanine ligase